MGQVVAAAILREGRVLACRRTSPPETAGRWELPGGKVEPGEDREAALVREIGEELGVVVEVTGWLDGAAPIGERHVLLAATARITAGEPRPREHDLIRWLAPDELEEVDWLEPDRPFVAQMATGERHRAIFFDEDDAVSVTERLLAEGWSAVRSRERFQGEDDDEDQPWSVVSDAPVLLLELLVDEYDGWLEHEADHQTDHGTAPVAPLDLPTAPRRVKRPPLDSPHA